MASKLKKNRVFFLRIFFFWGPICYKNSKIPKMLIYTYLTISMSSSIMCGSRNSCKSVVGVASFEILELYMLSQIEKYISHGSQKHSQYLLQLQWPNFSLAWVSKRTCKHWPSFTIIHIYHDAGVLSQHSYKHTFSP